jgi:HEXXH motif-containing protein
MRTHRVDADDFATLATGAGNVEAIRSLRAAELSRRIIVLHMAGDKLTAWELDPPSRDCVTQALALLASSSRRSRTVVDDVLMHPGVGSWAARCLCETHGDMPGGTEEDPENEVVESLGYIGGVAVAAALRAGEHVDLTVRAIDGRLFLPTIGHIQIGGTSAWMRASALAGSSKLRLSSRHLSIEVDVAGPGDGQWFPRQRLRSAADGCTLEMSVEDTDPYLEYGTLRAAGPSSAEVLWKWQAIVDDGWRLLVRHHRRQASAIAAGLTCLVPLGPNVSGHYVSATSGNAFGAVASTFPPDGLAMAAALVHEFQHAKLYALLHLVRLLDAGPGTTFYAPWRSDPRPLAGLLQGCYAFLGLVEFWHAQQSVGSPAARQRAAFEFARWRDAVDGVLDTLTCSGALTAEGRRFVLGLRERADAWLRVPVEAAVEAEARAAAAHHLAEWRSRYVETSRTAEVGP